jgi:DMSO/TMAO reductase YedYZ molybdopterin-dependent catalytic subunit
LLTRLTLVLRICGLVLFALLAPICNHSAASAQSSPASTSAPASPSAAVQLAVTGSVEKPLSLSADDLAHLPRTTIKVTNEHAGKDETYEGVLLSELLKQAGVPQGSRLNGKALATYVEAEGSDGYRVIFSLAELDNDFEDSSVLVADKMDGQPIAGNLGPLRLVVPHDKRPARWVRMLRSIKVTKVSD